MSLAPFWSVEGQEQRLAQLKSVVADLPDTATVTVWRCGTCARCQELYGMVPIFDPRFDRDRDGAHHVELAFDGTPRVFGGQVASATGLTCEEAWDNLMRALA